MPLDPHGGWLRWEKKVVVRKKRGRKKVIKRKAIMKFPLWLSRLRTRLASMRTWVRSLALLSGFRIRHCRELWCRSQSQLGSGIAMALV